MYFLQSLSQSIWRPHTRIVFYFAFTLGLAGCAGYNNWRDGSKLVEAGQVSQGMELMQQASKDNPEQYRMRYIATRDAEVQSLMKKATLARSDNRVDEARSAYQQVLRIDPQDVEASQGIAMIARSQREAAELEEAKAALTRHDAATARQILSALITENSTNAQARTMLQEVDARSTRASMLLPALNQALQAPVTLEFKDVDIRSVLSILTQTSGIGFILDKDVGADLRTTIYARNTSVADALNLILRTSQLDKKILNDTTILVYPATEEKRKRYDDLVVRSYYLNSADPKKVQDMLRTVVAPKSMYVDDRLKMLVVRDTETVQDAIGKLLDLHDIASPEVVLDVEVLEVNANDLLNVGIQYPSSVSLSMAGPSGVAGSIAINSLKSLNSSNFTLSYPDPFAVLNLRQTSSNTRTLANPRIRVLNREKASVLIGDKVPVITSTVNQTSNAITESVNYLDVGLKLEVEPEIHIDNDVTMRVALEVSNIVKEVRSSATGLLAYQIGTRNANTVLRLHEGETQALAGLIKNESQQSGSHIPGLGKIPVLGRLFSNDSDTSSRSEIVLLITPHIARSLAVPGAYSQAFPSGTAEQVSTQALRLTPAAQYSDSDNLVAVAVAAAPSISNTPDQKPAGTEAATHLASLGSNGAATDTDRADAVSFDLVAPSRMKSTAEISISLLSGGHGFEKAEVDLVLDQPHIKLSKVLPNDGVSIDARQEGDIIHISIGKTVSQGPVAVLTLRPESAIAGTLNLSLQNPKAQSNDQSNARAAVSLPKQIAISQ